MTKSRGSVVILLVLFLVALSVLGVLLYKSGFLGGYNPVSIPDNKVDVNRDTTEQIKMLEPGDDVDSIDKDLSQTNLDTIDDDVLGLTVAADSE